VTTHIDNAIYPLYENEEFGDDGYTNKEGDLLFCIRYCEDDLNNEDLPFFNDMIALSKAICQEDFSEDAPYIKIAFPLKAIIDNLDFLQCENSTHVDARHKPFFEKLKSELQSMIAKIDSIEFVGDNADD